MCRTELGDLHRPRVSGSRPPAVPRRAGCVKGSRAATSRACSSIASGPSAASRSRPCR